LSINTKVRKPRAFELIEVMHFTIAPVSVLPPNTRLFDGSLRVTAAHSRLSLLFRSLLFLYSSVRPRSSWLEQAQRRWVHPRLSLRSPRAWGCGKRGHSRRGARCRAYRRFRREPGVMSDSQEMRLPSTTPQPAAAKAGSICSALVSASFIGSETSW